MLLVSWQKYQRTISLIDVLRCESLLVERKGNKIISYIMAIIKTIMMIKKKSPKILITTNPSFALCIIAVLVRKLLGFKLVIDAHNEGVEPYINTNKIFLLLTQWLHRSADITIVTNEALSKIVKRNGGNPAILPDPLPRIIPPNKEKDRKRYVICICTYAPDEPVEEIINEFKKSGIDIYFTGKVPKVIKERYSDQLNIVFTGYLSDDEYIQKIYNSLAIIDLTLMPSCLVCGVYEAIALNRPILVSDDEVYRKTFLCKTVIPTNIGNLLYNTKKVIKNDLSREAIEEREYFEKKWNKQFDYLIKDIIDLKK